VTIDSTPEQVAPVIVGAAIRHARENAKLSIQQISDRTYIRPDVIADIENDNFSSTGGAAYARGHIRTLAKLLHLNGDALVENFSLMTGEVDRPMIDLLTENNATPLRREAPKLSYKTLSSIAAGVVALLILVPAVGSFLHSSASKKKSVTTSASTSASTTIASVPATTTVAAKSAGVTVVLNGIGGSSWVGLTDSQGNQVFSGRISQGDSKTFTDATQLNVVIGNAGAVDVNVNGKDLGSLGAVGEVLHLSYGPTASTQG
jgi:cytoskeleton protein RodZ